MTESILDSTKLNLGIDPAYEAFDPQIILHINSVLSTLTQLGVGPEDGWMIGSSEEVWADFLGADSRYNMVKTYVYLRVRLMFDPPATSFAIASMERQAEEMEWRINVIREGDHWVSPLPPPIVIEDEVILEGGSA